MASAARVHLVEKGRDPRNYAMVGFGGAGPAHAAEVARLMGVRELIIPPASGAASALGFLAAPLSFELVRSLPVEFHAGFDAGRINALLDELAGEGMARLAEGGVVTEITVERTADMRLVGQMHDISVKLPAGVLTGESLDAIRAAFEATYTTRYSAPFAGFRFEAINFRVRVAGPTPVLSLRGATGGGDAASRLKGTRRAFFGDGYVDAPVYDRYALRRASGSRGRRSSRSASRPPSCSAATWSASMPI